MNTSSYEKTTLSNGVRLILVPMEGVNSVATSVMIGVGSRYETPEINGISHFLEHMVFKGTKKYPTTDDVNIVEREGGLQNAYTDIDITSYHNKVLASDWELGLEINKELALYPLIEEKHVDRERSVIIEEMKRYEDEPAMKVEEVFHTMLYPGTRLGMRIIGEDSSLRSVEASTLHGYHHAWYLPERMVVVIAGQFKIQNSKGKITIQNSKVKDLVQEWFGGFPKRRTGDIEVVKEKQEKPKIEVVTKKDAQQAHIMLGLRTYARGSDERFAWNIFNLLMGVSFTSRLFKEIREKRGLCYHIRSSSNNWADVGNWSVYAGVATEKVGEAVKAIMDELALVMNKGVTQDEVKVSIKRIKTMLAFRSEDPEFLNEFYGRQELFHEPIMTLEEYVSRIEKVTKEQIYALVKKYITAKTLNLALVWNRPPDPSLEPLLTL